MDTGFSILGVKKFIIIPYDQKKGKWLKPTTTENPDQMKIFGPTTAISNYGFGGFEGMKARRSRANGRIALLPTPELNFCRILKLIKFYEAENSVSEKLPGKYWLDALALLVKEHADVIPKSNEGEYYIRPVFAKGEQLGMKIHPTNPQGITFFGTPVKNYYPPELEIYTLTEEVRCMPGGTGWIKSAANYSKSMDGQRKARAKGYDDALFLDETLIKPSEMGWNGNIYKTEIGELLSCNIQELTVANVCIIKDGTLYSPAERDTILPSTTKKHIFQIAQDLLKMGIIEKRLTLREFITADEAFACGTAAGITPIVGVGVKNNHYRIKYGKHGKITGEIKRHMSEIYWGEKDPFHWMCKIEI